jgi:Zn-finger nucleic acid-binding protein
MTNKVEALNCPNCGAGVMSDSPSCEFCKTRLKTIACPKCFGLMFFGSEHCSHCGHKAEALEIGDRERDFLCPRCQVSMNALLISETNLSECKRCAGMWVNAETFETICVEREKQSAIFEFVSQKKSVKLESSIKYVPCPECSQLMNRKNFAQSSGVIVDLCKNHGIWFDANELPDIINFIIKGGLDRQREREKIQIEEERRRIREEARSAGFADEPFADVSNSSSLPETIIRAAVKMIFK